MSTTIKILISAIGIGAMLGTPAIARTRVVHHRAVYPGAYAGPTYNGASNGASNALSGARTGNRYSGPYDERIITQPNGIVSGTDPDPKIRAYMRRDNIGPNGGSGGGGGNTSQ
jgi:hypothetical protein